MAQRIGDPCCAGGMKGCLARLYLAWLASAAALICAALNAGDDVPSSPSLLWSASISEPSLARDGTRRKPLVRCCCCAASAAARCAPLPPSAPLGLRVAAAALARGERAPSAAPSLSSPSSSSSSSSSSSPSSSRSASSSSLSWPSQMTGLARGGLALVPLPKEEPLRWPGLAPAPPPSPTEPAAGRIAAAPRSSAAMSRSSRATCSGLASALTEATRTNVSLSDAILDSSSAMLVTPSAMSLVYSPGNAVPMSGPAAAAAAAAASSLRSFRYSACDWVNAVNLDSSSGGSSLPFGSHTSSLVYTYEFMSGPFEPSSVFSR
mmetsp:Transcript_14248/g.60251  ORF Transcript_14248/g.60251 Transcript_14248/m.60251 type:complete len:321 (+) Transcript_14248:2115-3077(+)